MAKKSKRPASRGSVNNIILEILSTGDKYGYEIIKEVEEKTDGKIKLKQPSLYSSLNRFEDKEFVTSYWQDSEIGGKRHYYTITKKGLEYFEESKMSAFDKIELKNRQNKSSNKIESTTPPKVDSFTEIEDDEDILLTQPDMSLFELDDEDIDVTSDEYIKNLSINNEDQEIDESDQETEYTDNIEPLEEDYFDVVEDLDDDNNEIDFYDDEEELTQIDDVKNLDDLFEEIKTENAKVESITSPIVSEKTEITISPIDWKSNRQTFTPSEYDQEKHDESMKILYGDIESNMIIDDKDQNEEDKRKSIEILNNTESKNDTIIPLKEEISVELKNTEQEPNDNKIPEKKYIIDENGIIKIENKNNEYQKTDKIFDNVIYRTSQTGHNITSYNDLGLSKHSAFSRQTSNFKSVTEDEKPKEEVQQQPKVDINYKSILGELYTNDINNDEELETPTPLESNNEEIDDEYNYKSSIIKDEVKEELAKQNSDEIIQDFEESGVKIKLTKNDYIEKEEKDFEFVLINKIKFAFGLIMFLLMSLELTITLLILKGSGLVYTKDYLIYGIGYAIIFAISLIYVLPILFNKTKRKEKTNRFKYSIILGSLAFLICCVFTYAINTFIGLNISNMNLYASSLLVPTILTFNFIIGPIIYKLLIDNKHFY